MHPSDLSRDLTRPQRRFTAALRAATWAVVVRWPRRLTQRLVALAFLAAGLLPQASLAALPTVAAPTSGNGGGGLMGTLQGYLAMAGVLVGLTLATAAFLVVGGGALGQFNEARQRGEWGGFATTLIIGVILIVAVVWLATQAATIL